MVCTLYVDFIVVQRRWYLYTLNEPIRIHVKVSLGVRRIPYTMSCRGLGVVSRQQAAIRYAVTAIKLVV